MLIDDILPALDLPAAAVKNQTIPHTSLLENGAHHPGDANRILHQIESVRWLASLSHLTTGVLPLVRPGLEYFDIGVLAIVMRAGAKLGLLAEALHNTLPNPAVIFFASGDEVVEVSVAHKKLLVDTRHRTVIWGQVNHCPVQSAPADADFLEAVHWPELPKSDLFAVYQSWQDRVTALKVACLTGVFRLSTDATELMQRHRILTEFVCQFRNRVTQLRTLRNELCPRIRADIKHEIELTDAVMANLRRSLQTPHCPPAQLVRL